MARTPEKRQCDEWLPHKFHVYDRNVRTYCDGKNTYNKRSHEAHSYFRYRDCFCEGVP